MQGSCLCRGIAWEMDSPLSWAGHCHCSMCRKAHGSAFATFAGGDTKSFRWLRGESLITRYRSSAQGARPFCSVCGAVVPNATPDGSMVFAALATSDDLTSVAFDVGHVFVGSKAPWYELPDDGLARFATMPEAMGGAPVGIEPPPGAPPASHPGVLRGSCLCGGVAYETGPARGLVYCHCSRCRKGRSSAFAANVFAEPEPFRYTRGADLVRIYKVPEAARFTVAFCTVCGGGVPRDPNGARYLVVPAGSLDDDPGPLPRPIHIFVGSKSPWFEIADGLEQWDAYPEGYASSHEWVARNTRGV